MKIKNKNMCISELGWKPTKSLIHRYSEKDSNVGEEGYAKPKSCV